MYIKVVVPANGLKVNHNDLCGVVQKTQKFQHIIVYPPKQFQGQWKFFISGQGGISGNLIVISFFFVIFLVWKYFFKVFDRFTFTLSLSFSSLW